MELIQKAGLTLSFVKRLLFVMEKHVQFEYSVYQKIHNVGILIDTKLWYRSLQICSYIVMRRILCLTIVMRRIMNMSNLHRSKKLELVDKYTSRYLDNILFHRQPRI